MGTYDEERAYCELHNSLDTIESIEAFKKVVSNVCLGIMFSFFASMDEGIDMKDGTDSCQSYDIVDGITRESIILTSAHDEFFDQIPDDLIPFSHAAE